MTGTGQVLFALATVAGAVGGLALWFWAATRALEMLVPDQAQWLRPWLFMGPAVLMMGLYLVLPACMTAWASLHGADGSWAGTRNYRWMMADQRVREAIWNTALWVALVPAVSTGLGLVAARMAQAVRWGGVARALMVFPLAISFTGAGVIWKFVYDYRALGQPQTGLLNALVTAAGGAPQTWLSLPYWNDLFLMVVMVWSQTGFAMVILSVALRRIPPDTLHAAILDGAGPVRRFFRVEVPQIRGTLAVVWTTISIAVLKLFDIVFIMTNGQWGTQMLSNVMYDWMFRGAPDQGRGTAVAMLMMALMVPVMVWTMRRTGREQS